MLSGFVEYVDCKPGYVYLLYHFDKLVYIGSTINLSNRINEHRKRSRIVFNRVFYKSYSFEEARAVEAKMILELQPPENITGKTKADIAISKPINLSQLGFDVRKYGGEPSLRRV